MRAINTLAKQIVHALRGQWNGSSGMARCPAHADRIPSLAVTEHDGKVLVHCYAGCDQKSVLSALHRLGLWPTANRPLEWAKAAAGHKYETDVSGPSNNDHAVQTWMATSHAEGTPAERYLRHRGITATVPPSLRFAPRLLHGPSGQYLSAVIAAIHTAGGALSAIQRVFIRNDGLGKAEVTPAKMSLGPLGDGAVRLAPVGEVVGVCEGWETGLSAMQLYNVPVWCALSASRMHRVMFPATVRRVVIFADKDPAGHEAAERTAHSHRRCGHSVEIRLPAIGLDFNDELTAEAPNVR
jgi:putative DNA primase/helicase